ncbi:MAG: hypothetical protein AB9921_05155 [Erysipelotrichaceae bacterium]
MEKWVGSSIRSDEAKEISGISVVSSIPQFDAAFARTIVFNAIQTVYIEQRTSRREITSL